MKFIKQIPLSDIAKIEIYINSGRKSLTDIKRETGANYIINGGLFKYSPFEATCQVKSNGKVYADDGYKYYGYGWEQGYDISMQSLPNNTFYNYIACCALIDVSGKVQKPIYNKDVGGKAERTAIGLKGNDLVLYVSNDEVTPEALRDELFTFGCKNAIMLDGGGSTQCDLNGDKIQSSRIVHNLILVYTKDGEKMPDRKYTVCLDAGHGLDTVNASPDGTYKEVEFTWNMYEILKPMLESQGINVVGTRTYEQKPSLTERATVSNSANADLFISLHTNAIGDGNWNDANGLLVLTSSSGATASRNVLANRIISTMQSSGVRLNGTGLRHDMSLTVLTKTNAPACLIEFGFHTNKADVELLKMKDYRVKLATCVTMAICEQLGVTYKAVVQDDKNAPSDWAKTAWDKAVAKKVVDGTRPKDAVTREELCIILDRLNMI